ncbi:MAG: S8 family serine peptidase [Candidatus Dojkabacteria bacterium]
MMRLKTLAVYLLSALIVLGTNVILLPVNNVSAQSEPDGAEEVLDRADEYDLDHLFVKYKNSDEPQLVEVDPASNGQITVFSESNKYDGDIVEKQERLADKFNQLLDNPRVEYVQPQYIYSIGAWSRSGTQDTPDDFDTTSPYNHWYYDASNVREMWQDQDCQGGGAGCGGDSNATVAVIDTGLAYESRTSAWGDSFAPNDDMFGGSNINLYTNTAEINGDAGTNCFDEIDDDGNGFVDDCYGFNSAEYIYCSFTTSCTTTQEAEMGHPNDDGGHGTYVTGLIASLVDNNLGSVSPAHNVTIMPIKASFFHSGSFGSMELWWAIDYAVNQGADVINLSLAGPTFDQGLSDKLQWAKDNGVTVVAATGNTNSSVYYPAAFDSVIAVGAVRPNGTRAFYSNYGTDIDITAYVGNGGGIGDTVYQRSYTCFFLNPNCYSTNAYTTFSNGYGIGTSYASPQVAAMVALIISAKPSITRQGIDNHLFGDATDLGTVGWDNQTGWGVIDFEKTYKNVSSNGAPTLAILEPNGVGDTGDTSFNITWTDSDPDDDAVINFYRDNDGAGFDGVLISGCDNIAQSAASDTCKFDTRPLPADDYYIYGCITDYVNPLDCSYGGGPITISHTPIREFGLAVVSTDWVPISFQKTYSDPPIVFAEVSSENGTNKIFADIRNVTSAGFEVRIEENTMSGWNGIHGNEDISWYAVQSNTGAEKVGESVINTDWVSIDFLTSFASIPELFVMVQSENGGNIVYADVRNVSTTGFDVRLEEPVGWNGLHSDESVGWIAFETNPVTGGQEGKATTDQDWSTVSFTPAFSEPPVLIVSVDTENEGNYVNADIRNLDANGFEFMMEEDILIQNGIHGDETVSWAAFPLSTINSQSGTVSINSNWTEIYFPQSFESKPKVFVEINTENGQDTAEVDIKDVMPYSFTARIEEDKLAGWGAGGHTTETITWYAILNPGSGEQVGNSSVDHNWKTVTFSSPFTSTPKVFADVQTENGGQTAAVDMKNITTTAFEVKVEEDPRAGYDGNHAVETVSWLAFETPSMGETGTVAVDQDWTAVDLSSFGFSGVPKLLADIQTENGTHTVQVDIRNLSSTGFDVRMEEEPRIWDGLHALETVSWLAWE